MNLYAEEKVEKRDNKFGCSAEEDKNKDLTISVCA